MCHLDQVDKRTIIDALIHERSDGRRMKITLKDNGIYAIEANEDELWFLDVAASKMPCELCEHRPACDAGEDRPYCKRMKDVIDGALFGKGADSA